MNQNDTETREVQNDVANQEEPSGDRYRRFPALVDDAKLGSYINNSPEAEQIDTHAAREIAEHVDPDNVVHARTDDEFARYILVTMHDYAIFRYEHNEGPSHAWTITRDEAEEIREFFDIAEHIQ